MRRWYRILLASSIMAIAAALLFVALRRHDTLAYAFAYAPIEIPGVDLYPPFRWVFLPAMILAIWSWAALARPQAAGHERSLTLHILTIAAILAMSCLKRFPGQVDPPLAVIAVGISLAAWEWDFRHGARIGAAYRRLPWWAEPFAGSALALFALAAFTMLGVDGPQWNGAYEFIGITWLVLSIFGVAIRGWTRRQVARDVREVDVGCHLARARAVELGRRPPQASWPEHERLTPSELSSLRRETREDLDLLDRAEREGHPAFRKRDRSA